MTEAEAAEFDERQHIESWVSMFARLGVTQAKFDAARERLSKQWHVRAPVNDAKWAVLNQLITTKRDPEALVDIYREMTRIAEGEGKDVSQLRAERDKWIAEWIRRDFHREIGGLGAMVESLVVTISTCNDGLVCAHCKAVSERRYRPKDFLSQMPIPHGCQNPDGCRCWFSITIK